MLFSASIFFNPCSCNGRADVFHMLRISGWMPKMCGAVAVNCRSLSEMKTLTARYTRLRVSLLPCLFSRRDKRSNCIIVSVRMGKHVTRKLQRLQSLHFKQTPQLLISLNSFLKQKIVSEISCCSVRLECKLCNLCSFS